MKVVKRKKSSRMSGRKMGTHGSGARKNKRKSGNKGGTGLSGTGKRADHKKTLVQKLYGHNYFGKKGITRGRNKRDTRKRINVGEIQINLEKYAKKGKEDFEVNLKDYKILGKGEVKNKLNITCLEISKSAREKVEAVGGTVKVKEIKKIETPLVTFNKKNN
jgi:large subunit ribosomal protein L15